MGRLRLRSLVIHLHTVQAERVVAVMPKDIMLTDASLAMEGVLIAIVLDAEEQMDKVILVLRPLIYAIVTVLFREVSLKVAIHGYGCVR
jgi:hypothetical protein